MWPAWTWIHRPQERFLASSYAQTLSTRDSVKCRRVIESALYQARWGDKFKLYHDQNTKTRYDNTEGGYRLATSVEGVLTGEGGDIILVDDPISSLQAGSEIVRETVRDWWDQSMSSRLNDASTGAYVIIMQRLHEQDLTGHLLAKGGWHHLCLPARYEDNHPYISTQDIRKTDGDLLWPHHITEEALSYLENDLGPYGTAGQLQQRPAPRAGGMFDPQWWDIVDSMPPGGKTVRAWDLASSEKKNSPWTVGLKMTRVNNTLYIEDVARLRGRPAAVEAAVRNTATQDGHSCLIDLPQDPGQAGKAQISSYVKMLIGYNVRSSPESGSKVQRAEPLSAQTEGGNVKLLRGAWNKVFIDEAAVFPNSDFKDQIDAASRAFHQLLKRFQRVAATPGELFVG